VLDLAVFRAEPAVFGPVGSDPTVSWTIARLSGDASKVLAAIDSARAIARPQVSQAAGADAPDRARTAASPLVIGIGAALVTARTRTSRTPGYVQGGVGAPPVVRVRPPRPDGTGEA